LSEPKLCVDLQPQKREFIDSFSGLLGWATIKVGKS